jgi:hypothetical protein
MDRIPWSIAFRAASSAASCAAKGVLFRDPLNPRDPALDHDTVLPLTSVIVTTVLLKVDWMCAIPEETFFLTFFFGDLVLPPAAGVAGAAAGAGGGLLVFESDMTVRSYALARCARGLACACN